MRTNIDIDDAVLDAAMRAGPFTTKKDAVEAGLRLLARQAAYRELLRWEGQLQWDGDDNAHPPAEAAAARSSAGPALGTGHRRPAPALLAQEPAPPGPVANAVARKRRHGGG